MYILNQLAACTLVRQYLGSTKFLFKVNLKYARTPTSLPPMYVDWVLILESESDFGTDNEFAEPIFASLRTQTTQFLLKKCHSGGEPLATLCPTLPAQDLNLGPPAPQTNVLPLDQLHRYSFDVIKLASCPFQIHKD